MAAAKSFRELNVYRLGLESATMVFEMTRNFPREETYSLTDQIRRSSRAVTAMIAEAWARRRYKAAFINKIDEALGEAMETQSWLDHAKASRYIDEGVYGKLDRPYQQIGGMLSRMIDRADDFCKNPSNTDYRTLREDSPSE
jgi:four helix bundle protein